MQTLFNLIEENDSPKFLTREEIFLSPNDLQDKDPKFFAYLQEQGIPINNLDFPFSLKQGSQGAMQNEDTKVYIISGEEMLRQVYGITAHRDEISRDWQIVRDNPGKYIMFSTNGCKFSTPLYNELSAIFKSAIKRSGYGLPLTPDELVSEALKHNIYVAQYGEANDYENEENKNLTGMVILPKDLTQDINRFLPLNPILQLEEDPSDHGMRMRARKARNILTFDELPIFSYNRSHYDKLVELVRESNPLRQEIYSYSSKLIMMMHYSLINCLKEFTNLDAYLTKDEIRQWEECDMEELLKNGLIDKIQRAAEHVDLYKSPAFKQYHPYPFSHSYIKFEVKVAAVEYCKLIALHNEIGTQSDPALLDQNLLTDLLSTLYNLYTTRILTFLRNMNDTPHPYYMSSVMLSGYGDINTYYTPADFFPHEKLLETFEDQLHNYAVEFAENVKPICERLINPSHISPLYQHYEKYKALEKEAQEREAQAMEAQAMAEQEKQTYESRVNAASNFFNERTEAGYQMQASQDSIPSGKAAPAASLSGTTSSINNIAKHREIAPNLTNPLNQSAQSLSIAVNNKILTSPLNTFANSQSGNFSASPSNFTQSVDTVSKIASSNVKEIAKKPDASQKTADSKKNNPKTQKTKTQNAAWERFSKTFIPPR